LQLGDSDVDFDVARDILRFYLRNPQAADSVEGLARWRLLDEKIYSTLDKVTRAVSWLVSQELLVKEPTSPFTSVFRFNESERQKSESFVQRAMVSEEDRAERKTRGR
jgi:hypothetical protein